MLHAHRRSGGARRDSENVRRLILLEDVQRLLIPRRVVRWIDSQFAKFLVDGFATDLADDTLATTAEGIWALGDVLGRYQFRHAANHEARTVVRNLLLDGPDETVDYTAMPHAVFASPQVAGAGETEQALRDADRDYAVRTYDYADTAMGDALKETDGFVRVLVDPADRTILGCHVLGPEAPTLLHEVLPVMRAGGTVADIADTVHVHPALSEVVHRAFAGQFNRPSDGHTHHEHGD